MNILSSKGTAITGLPQSLAKKEVLFGSFSDSESLFWIFISHFFHLCITEQNNCSGFPLQHYFPIIFLAANKSVEYGLQSFLLT